MQYMKSLILLMLLAVLTLPANCPPGSHFVPNGNLFCYWSSVDNSFQCDPVGDCMSDCPTPYGDPCDAAASLTTRVKKLPNGHLQITRLVIHTEKKLDAGAPHSWVLRKDPDTGKQVTVIVGVPVAQTLGPKLKALIARYESALAEQFGKSTPIK
jgi:hypothetical protein